MLIIGRSAEKNNNPKSHTPLHPFLVGKCSLTQKTISRLSHQHQNIPPFYCILCAFWFIVNVLECGHFIYSVHVECIHVYSYTRSCYKHIKVYIFMPTTTKTLCVCMCVCVCACVCVCVCVYVTV